jgi:hypothetical protein
MVLHTANRLHVYRTGCRRKFGGYRVRGFPAFLQDPLTRFTGKHPPSRGPRLRERLLLTESVASQGVV